MKRSEPVSRWMTPAPWTLDEDETVERAAEIFRTQRIRHLPVLRERRLVGMLSERDMFVAAQFAQTSGLKVGVLMAPNPVVVAPDSMLSTVAERLWVTSEGAAVVVEDGHVLGVFTAVDALRALADASKAELAAGATLAAAHRIGSANEQGDRR